MTFLSEHAGTLLLGSTAVLLVGCVAVALSRIPVHQKRIGELAVWGVLAFLVLIAVPLPRLLMSEGTRRTVQELASPDLVTVAWPPANPAPQELLAKPVDLERGEPEVVRTTAPDRATTVSSSGIDDPPVLSRGPVAEVGVGSPVLDGLVAVYLVGAATCLLWLLTGGVYLLLLLGRAGPAPRWVRDLLPGRNGPRVVVTPYRCRPFCIGWFRGKIVLPAHLVCRERQEQIRLVLLHEVGHLRQADLGGQLPLGLLLPILFFNPLFWWLRARMRLASELLADDWAARGSTRADYARELISLAEEDARLKPAPLGAACILRSPSEFYRRIKMLLEREGNLSVRCSRGRNVLQTAVATVLIAGLASMGGVTAQDRVVDTIEAIKRQLEALQRENESLRQQLEKAKEAGGVQSISEFLEDPEDRFKIGMEFLFPERGATDPEPAKAMEEEPESRDPLRAPRLGGLLVPEEPPRGIVGGLTDDPVPVPGLAGTTTTTRSLPGRGGLTGADETYQVPGGLPQAQGYRASPGNILDSATLQLMNQAIDLEIDMENGEAELEHMESMAGANFVTRSSLTQVRNSLRGTKRKLELIRRTIKAEVQLTEQELELLTARRDQYAKGSTPYREMEGVIQRLHHRREILISVL